MLGSRFVVRAYSAAKPFVQLHGQREQERTSDKQLRALCRTGRGPAFSSPLTAGPGCTCLQRRKCQRGRWRDGRFSRHDLKSVVRIHFCPGETQKNYHRLIQEHGFKRNDSIWRTYKTQEVCVLNAPKPMRGDMIESVAKVRTYLVRTKHSAHLNGRSTH